MSDDLTEIPGIGPASAEGFRRAGIAHASELRALGAHEAYARWIAAGNPPHFIGYYALHMALQGRPWNDCRGAEKTTLRARFDALKTGIAAGATPDAASSGQGTGHDKGRARLDAALDQIGLIRRA